MKNLLVGVVLLFAGSTSSWASYCEKPKCEVPLWAGQSCFLEDSQATPRVSCMDGVLVSRKCTKIAELDGTDRPVSATQYECKPKATSIVGLQARVSELNAELGMLSIHPQNTSCRPEISGIDFKGTDLLRDYPRITQNLLALYRRISKYTAPEEALPKDAKTVLKLLGTLVGVREQGFDPDQMRAETVREGVDAVFEFLNKHKHQDVISDELLGDLLKLLTTEPRLVSFVEKFPSATRYGKPSWITLVDKNSGDSFEQKKNWEESQLLADVDKDLYRERKDVSLRGFEGRDLVSLDTLFKDYLSEHNLLNGPAEDADVRNRDLFPHFLEDLTTRMVAQANGQGANRSTDLTGLSINFKEKDRQKNIARYFLLTATQTVMEPVMEKMLAVNGSEQAVEFHSRWTVIDLRGDTRVSRYATFRSRGIVDDEVAGRVLPDLLHLEVSCARNIWNRGSLIAPCKYGKISFQNIAIDHD